MLEIELTSEMLALVPIVAAILQVAKRIKAVENLKEWFPFLSVAVAYGLCYFSGVTQPVMPSIVIGLVASGGYDLVKGKMTKSQPKTK